MTTALAFKTSRVPRGEVTRVVAPRITFIKASTPSAIGLSALGSEYTDAQFYADLRKASKKLDAMEAKALKEHAEGKTRKLP